MYGPLDKELELRDIAADAVTATTAEPGKALAVTMAGAFKAVFIVSAVAEGGTYRLSVETDVTAAFTDPTEISAMVVVATGIYEMPLTQWQINQSDPGAVAIRCKATLGGATPGITYGCFLVPA